METQAQMDKEDCTVAVCKCGGAVIMVLTSFIDKETKKELGEAAADGCEIKHLAAEEVRKMEFGCTCQPTDGQLGFAI